MPIFWFVSFVNKIKRIRDKTFYFDVRFRPNLRTRHTTCIHRAGWNSAELHGIHMSELPLLLLGKWVTIGSLSQNLFCQLQAKCEWLTILESLKNKKNKHGQRSQLSTKKTRCSYELKSIHLYCVHFGLLPKTSPGGFCLLSSISISVSTFSIVPHTPSGRVYKFWLALGLCLYTQFLEDMCKSSIFSLLTCMGSMLVYSIPRGYVHKCPWCSDLRGSPWWKIH